MKIRLAREEDLAAIVEMLATDLLGKTREKFSHPVSDKYVRAFDEIDKDPNNELLVVEEDANEVIATCQLTFIPNLTYEGGLRAQVEAVRVRDDFVGKGVGTFLIEGAIERCRQRGAILVQLTSNKQRPDAIRFYKRLGFEATHEGMKLFL